jgi:hypothetical protein
MFVDKSVTRHIKQIVFQLMFPIAETEELAALYPEDWDTEAFVAGKRIREGDYTRSNLEIIVAWKSTIRINLIAQNSDSEIADALSLALAAKEPRSAFAVLTGLRGVALPMASAILTAIDQEKYIVVDWRAVEALGVPNVDYWNLNFYLRSYFPECKRLASQASVSLREFDRALWSWSKKKEGSKGVQS